MRDLEANTEIATAAAVIALAALCVSIWEGFQNRKHNRLSVRPRLRLDGLTYTGKPIQVLVKNNGTRLAIEPKTIFLGCVIGLYSITKRLSPSGIAKNIILNTIAVSLTLRKA